MKNSKKCTYLVVAGGLGNQMFILASGFCLATRWDRNLSLVDNWYFKDKRGESFAPFPRTYELNKFPRILEGFPVCTHRYKSIVYELSKLARRMKIHGIFVENDNDLNYKGFLLDNEQFALFGYFQSPKYFQDSRPEISELFSLESDQEMLVKTRVGGLRCDYQRLVAIHVRRGDTLLPGNEWVGQLSEEYYRGAMRSFDSDVHKFVVFTDDPSSCERLDVFKDATILEENDSVTALTMMKYCDDFIIAGSSFSWWGAWLGESRAKRVIAPIPFNKGRSLEVERDLIPPEWERRRSYFL